MLLALAAYKIAPPGVSSTEIYRNYGIFLAVAVVLSFLYNAVAYRSATAQFRRVPLEEVYSETDRVGDGLGEDPADDSELYALAEDKLAGAAAASDLVDRAEDNTRQMLTTLARSLGVEQVEVRFAEAPGSAG